MLCCLQEKADLLSARLDTTIKVTSMHKRDENENIEMTEGIEGRQNGGSDEGDADIVTEDELDIGRDGSHRRGLHIRRTD